MDKATDFFSSVSYTVAKEREGCCGMMYGFLLRVILLVFLVDFLLLLGSNRLAGHSPEAVRCAVTALLGGCYGALCLLPGFHFLGNGFWRGVSLCGLSLIAFGVDAAGIRRGSIFLLLSMALSGIFQGMGQKELWILPVCAVLLWLLCQIGFPVTGKNGGFVPVELRFGDKKLTLTALRDTGNTLTDPVTGEQVLVAGADVGEALLALTPHDLRHPVETLASGQIRGLRLIPYRTVGADTGMMLALRLPGTRIGGRYRDALVAFAPEEIGKGEAYQMLTGGEV